MKLFAKKDEAISYVLDDSACYVDYGLSFKNISTFIMLVHGRYPKTGFVCDIALEQSWFVKAGKAELNINGLKTIIEPGEVILIQKAEKFSILGNKLEVIVSCAPAWYPEQRKLVE